MNKTPEFWQKFKRKSDKQVINNNNANLHEINGRKDVPPEAYKLNSVPLKNSNFSSKRSQNKNSICDEGHVGIKNKKNVSRGPTTCEDGNVDKTKLNKKYIEGLLHHITELKNCINFDDQCGPKFTWQNPTIFQPHTVNEQQIGDFNSHDLKRSEKKHNNGHTSSMAREKYKKTQVRKKLEDYIKNVPDHQRGIYTVTDPKKSNPSLVMSLQSLSKNTFVKINPKADNTKYFQDAAEDFIHQAEELKNKITCMLECCACETTTYSEHSINPITSDDNKSTVNSIDEIMFGGSFNESMYDPSVNRLLGTLSSQYDDILKVLSSIDKQIKVFNKPKLTTYNSNSHKHKKLSATSANICAYTPEGTNNKHEQSKSFLKKGKSDIPPAKRKNLYPQLDPVVLIYEPIKPKNDCTDEMCMHCGRGSDDNQSFRSQNITTRKKKENLKYGFVVTYTPNFSSNTKLSTTKDIPPTTKKKKKKCCCCC